MLFQTHAEIPKPFCILGSAHVLFIAVRLVNNSVSHPAVMLQALQILLPGAYIPFAVGYGAHGVNICRYPAVLPERLSAQLFQPFIFINKPHRMLLCLPLCLKADIFFFLLYAIISRIPPRYNRAAAAGINGHAFAAKLLAQ